MGAELLRSFPFLDAVVTGDGEQVLSELVSGRLANEPLVGLPGLLVAGDAGAAHSDGGGGAAPTGDAGAGEGSAADLDRLPTPDYGDYFDRLSGSPLAGSFVSRVPFETSRGCWWGERRRCIFCGQASASMLYRQKSPDRAVDELVELARRHPGSPVIVTDEILPRNAFDRFLPRAHEALPELEIVYFEVRADLDRSQLRTLAESGVQRVEAGLESLSTPVLKIIRKGTAMLQNLQFLKWARELAIDIVWNLLWGLPGEEPEDYESMAALVPLITHLQPPNTVGPFRLDRFSPAYQRSSELGMASVRPYPSYSHVYALHDQALQRLAYSFAFDYADKRPVELYTMALAEQIAAWKEAWPHSVLAFADHGDNLVFYDRQPGFDEEELTVIDGVHRAAYLACDSARSLKRLTEILSADLGTTVSADEVREVAESLIDERLMIADGETYLSLALRMPAGLGTAPREAGA
jgi:ribosomal peptide maturation radical SAM protein 1